MHEMPDTDTADAAAERFWPEGYKRTLAARVAERVASSFTGANAFEQAFDGHYGTVFESYPGFVERISEIVAIGAENGTDQVFDEIHRALSTGSPLPAARTRARYLWPEPIDGELGGELLGTIAAEYRGSHAIEHLHEDHSAGDLDFEAFVDRLARLVVAGGANGADDALAAVYRSLLTGAPLPTARRRPRRLR